MIFAKKKIWKKKSRDQKTQVLQDAHAALDCKTELQFQALIIFVQVNQHVYLVLFLTKLFQCLNIHQRTDFKLFQIKHSIEISVAEW